MFAAYNHDGDLIGTGDTYEEASKDAESRGYEYDDYVVFEVTP